MKFSATIIILFLMGTALPIPLTVFEMALRYYRQDLKHPEGKIMDVKDVFEEYDFVIIGAGTAGSVVANRLSEVPGWKVLLLEAGKDEFFFSDIPLFTSYIQLTDYNWGYKTQREDTACLGITDRRCSWPRGKALGGTSVINYMIYTRGTERDYDRWESFGNPGWGFKDVFPYFLKSEDNTIPEYHESPYHSTGGYLTVGDVPWHTPLATAFLEAGEEHGFRVTDYNGEHPTGFSYIHTTIRNGSRCSASKAFLRPVRLRPNLHIATEARVTKILINPDTKYVYGVEFVRNKRTHIVRARKEVVLSAGAINSPQLLMLSGVGPRDHLEELGIPVIQDLKVGDNLHDHVAFIGLTFLVNDTVSLVEKRLQSPRYFLEYYTRHTGPLTIPGGVEGIAYVHTKYATASDVKPDLELLFLSGALSSDGGSTLKLSSGVSDEVYDEVFKPISNRDAWSIVPMHLRPTSAGRVRLKSKNPFHWPLMYHNYFSDRRDLEIIVEGIKKAIALSETKAFQKFDSRLHTIPIPGCAHLEFGTDPYWECAVRHLGIGLHHQSGTCKMGPASDPNAVVDHELKVYGIKGLRVVDASIMPDLPSAHLNAPTYMIGEKASDMIKRDWKKN